MITEFGWSFSFFPVGEIVLERSLDRDSIDTLFVSLSSSFSVLFPSYSVELLGDIVGYIVV